MLRPPLPDDIRAAFCSIHDRSAFLTELRAIAKRHSTHIICFNADVLAGRVHAAAAAALAARAFETGENITSTLEMESLLFAAGSRQCNVASSFGIHEGENRLFICCIPAQEGVWSSLERLLTITHENWDLIDTIKKDRLIQAFSLTPDEISAAGGSDRITDLVLERVALLQVLR